MKYTFYTRGHGVRKYQRHRARAVSSMIATFDPTLNMLVVVQFLLVVLVGSASAEDEPPVELS